MLIVQAQTFYDELGALVKQLGKMETYLATTKQVGLLPETLRVQQKQFMVGHPWRNKSIAHCSDFTTCAAQSLTTATYWTTFSVRRWQNRAQ